MEYEWKYSETEIDWDELAKLYRLAPLGNKNPSILHKTFTNSMFKCFVYEKGLLIGVGRALADGADCSYICDIAVLPQYQGKGLGKKIVNKLLDLSKGHNKIILYSVPGSENFYKQLGFKKMTTALAIFQNHKNAIDIGLITDS